jgi:hypothetical protein
MCARANSCAICAATSGKRFGSMIVGCGGHVILTMADNVYGVLDAWPAHGQITSEGFLAVTEPLEDPLAGEVVYSFSDDDAGTVVQWKAGGSRDGAFNAVYAKGQYPDSAGMSWGSTNSTASWSWLTWLEASGVMG